MRNIPIIAGNYYHIFNRGNNKQFIFKESNDFIRFLFLILYFQSSVSISHISRLVSTYHNNNIFNVDDEVMKNIIDNRYIELVGFVLMPNHFHLIVLESKEGGISKYMQRVLNSYTKYFNTKYEQTGHLFQGPYKAVHIGDDNQLSYLSAYQHRNPRELKKWKNREVEYPWSSYQDYAKENRWGKLLLSNIITDKFDSGEEYREFVQNCGAKEFFDEN